MADGHRVLFKHPRTERYVIVYTLTLPAVNQGLVFRDVGAGGPVVDSVVPGGWADKHADIAPGDRLLRCTAYEIDVDHANLAPKPFVFDCSEPTPETGLPPTFEVCMRALQSTEILSTGFVHRKVTCEFIRDVRDLREREEHDRFLARIAQVGLLEEDREAAERRGERVPQRAPGEHPDGVPVEPLFVEDVYPVDD
ncbi:unnamed product [Ostreococcus tauri]|uniref:Unnamed product n=1 Tax=Ostreococcus tauri TaxID=70448 RepID=A0A090M7W6_OSTTA|nr:unnamed product [Ostreococcus tauri]CEF98224.1 unnamed product [Ostreococcus tauri]|eukprot:XP_022839146.1 unnamed product [Ostreococcus tauri]